MSEGLSLAVAGLAIMIVSIGTLFTTLSIRDLQAGERALRTELTQLQRCVYHQECPK